MYHIKGPSGQEYAHNGDFSGPIVTSIPVRGQASYTGKAHACASEPHRLMGKNGVFVEVQIPFEDLRAIVLAYLRNRAIAELERMPDDELEGRLLGLPHALLGNAYPAFTERETVQVPHDSTPVTAPEVGQVYCLYDLRGALAHVHRITDEGHVLFSVWNPSRPYGWQEGAGLGGVEEFVQLYPYRYTGPMPEPLPVPGDEVDAASVL